MNSIRTSGCNDGIFNKNEWTLCGRCAMGPCQVTAESGSGAPGWCGAGKDEILASNFAARIAAGASGLAHHGLELLSLLRRMVGTSGTGVKIHEPEKLEDIAVSLGIDIQGLDTGAVADKVYPFLEHCFSQLEGEIPAVDRMPPKTRDIWRQLSIVPRGILREIMEMMHYAHQLTGRDIRHLTDQMNRTALAGILAGSMLGSDMSDILFGTPSAQCAEFNTTDLKDDQINIVAYRLAPSGMEALKAYMVLPEVLEAVRTSGAVGVNLIHMGESSAEQSLSKELPAVEDVLTLETVLIAGAVDAVVTALPCFPSSLAQVAGCYGTPIFTADSSCSMDRLIPVNLTSPDASGSMYKIVEEAIFRFQHRRNKVKISDVSRQAISGFSPDYIRYMLGGSFRSGFSLFRDNIINGRIRGIAFVFGDALPDARYGAACVDLVRSLIRQDVLVFQTGCSRQEPGREGFHLPEAAEMAGPGLKELCEAVGMPPVLVMGSCYDHAAILTIVSDILREGGLGDSLADFPIAAAAPGWLSDRDICLGHGLVVSGIYTIVGADFPTIEGTPFHQLLTSDFKHQGLGTWDHCTDPCKMADKMIACMDAKRQSLGIDRHRERVLYDMSARRQIEKS